MGAKADVEEFANEGTVTNDEAVIRSTLVDAYLEIFKVAGCRKGIAARSVGMITCSSD